MEDFIKDEHESYGMMGFSRAQTTGAALFGSSIRHQNIIIMRLHRAAMNRGLNRDWPNGTELVAEVTMSSTQFADLITTMNMGDGVPVTISYVRNDEKPHKDKPPYVSKIDQFKEEVAVDLEGLKNTADSIVAMAEGFIEKPGGKRARREFKEAIERLRGAVLHHIPFVEKQFIEQMDKTVQEAKGEIESFAMSVAMQTGIETIKASRPEIVEGSPTDVKALPEIAPEESCQR